MLGSFDKIPRTVLVDDETWEDFRKAAKSVGYSTRGPAIQELLIEFIQNPRRIFAKPEKASSSGRRRTDQVDDDLGYKPQ